MGIGPDSEATQYENRDAHAIYPEVTARAQHANATDQSRRRNTHITIAGSGKTTVLGRSKVSMSASLCLMRQCTSGVNGNNRQAAFHRRGMSRERRAVETLANVHLLLKQWQSGCYRLYSYGYLKVA